MDMPTRTNLLMSTRSPQAQVVYVVDDDQGVLHSVRFLLESVRLAVKPYDGGEALLAALGIGATGCVLTDVRMPGLSGLQLQQRLTAGGWTLPVIFMTGHGDVPLAVRALKAGAADFLEKPVNDQTLLDAIQRALATDAAASTQREMVGDARARFERLSPREVEVFGLVVQGQANKQVAQQLGLSEKTVEIHRSSVMRKMEAQTLAGLVRLAVTLEQRGLARAG